MDLSDTQIDRYARHIVLREIGGEGQKKLLAATVAIVGAGGIGAPAIQYLAAAGIGRLVLIDDDTVALSNLQRQVLFATRDVGHPKVVAAHEAVRRMNPDVAVRAVPRRIDAASAEAVLAGADVVLDGTDSFATRLAVADAALASRIPLVSAAVGQFEGQLAVYRGWEAGRPCYRCLVGDAPERPDASCADQGVLGALTGVLGALAAIEAIRQIVPFGSDSAGRLLLVDALAFRFRTIALTRTRGADAGAGMRGLTIVVADVSSERFRCALALAAAQAALGGAARLFLSGEAVSILREPVAGWEDAAHAEAGLPTLPELIEEALGLGVKLILCQSGLHLTGAEPRDYDARVEFGGMVSLLQTLGEDRLTFA